MRRFSRDTWLAIGLLIILLLTTIAAAIQQTKEPPKPPLASFSNTPNGTRALSLWLESLGYTVSSPVAEAFHPPEDASLIFLLAPTMPILESEWQAIDAWVEAGGTLIIAEGSQGRGEAQWHYDFRYKSYDPQDNPVAAQTPLLANPLLSTLENFRPAYYLDSQRDDFVTLLAAGPHPVLVLLRQGNGRIIISAATNPFSNAGLKQAGNADLVLNLLAGVPQGELVWFDEWHHGVRSESVEIIGPGRWLRYTPAGRSLLFAAGVVFLALLLQGQLFGRPVPLAREIQRRSPLEYITAIANLNRQAGHRRHVLEQYHQQIKRHFGRRYHIDPTSSDEQFVAELSRYHPGLDRDALAGLLRRLQEKNMNEQEMIRLAGEASDWLL